MVSALFIFLSLACPGPLPWKKTRRKKAGYCRSLSMIKKLKIAFYLLATLEILMILVAGRLA